MLVFVKTAIVRAIKVFGNGKESTAVTAEESTLYRL